MGTNKIVELFWQNDNKTLNDLTTNLSKDNEIQQCIFYPKFEKNKAENPVKIDKSDEILEVIKLCEKVINEERRFGDKNEIENKI